MTYLILAFMAGSVFGNVTMLLLVARWLSRMSDQGYIEPGEKYYALKRRRK